MQLLRKPARASIDCAVIIHQEFFFFFLSLHLRGGAGKISSYWELEWGLCAKAFWQGLWHFVEGPQWAHAAWLLPSLSLICWQCPRWLSWVGNWKIREAPRTLIRWPHGQNVSGEANRRESAQRVVFPLRSVINHRTEIWLPLLEPHAYLCGQMEKSPVTDWIHQWERGDSLKAGVLSGNYNMVIPDPTPLNERKY